MPSHSFYRIEKQEDLTRLLDRLVQQPDNPYHGLPQAIKDKVLEPIYENICEKLLEDAYKEVQIHNPDGSVKKTRGRKPCPQKSEGTE